MRFSCGCEMFSSTYTDIHSFIHTYFFFNSLVYAYSWCRPSTIVSDRQLLDVSNDFYFVRFISFYYLCNIHGYGCRCDVRCKFWAKIVTVKIIDSRNDEPTNCGRTFELFSRWCLRTYMDFMIGKIYWQQSPFEFMDFSNISTHKNHLIMILKHFYCSIELIPFGESV